MSFPTEYEVSVGLPLRNRDTKDQAIVWSKPVRIRIREMFHGEAL